jgi:hypothetical protein
LLWALYNNIGWKTYHVYLVTVVTYDHNITFPL